MRHPWITIPALAAAGVLLALLAGAQDTRGAQASLDELLQTDGMTQEEMAVELLRALDGTELAPPDCVPGQEMFDDVPVSSPFCSFIEELARRDITTGCGGDNFCPDATVSRAQMATFIVRALEEADGCRPAVSGTGAMRKVGSVCIDRYENSVWTQPNGGQQLTTQGQISAFCPADGQDCKDKIFARSVAGVEPAGDITWFQAQQALANSGKRLPTNAEWQMAVSGTPDDTGPDTTPCNTRSGSVQDTGANAGCISDWGVNDMVGNVQEWVADWVPASTACPGWGDVGEFSSDDRMCLAGASTTITGPGALLRGGTVFFSFGTDAGPFAVSGNVRPSDSSSSVGFRGAR